MNAIRTIRLTPLTAGLLIVLATWLVYANSLTGVFLFDDFHAIAQNLSIRRLWPLWPVLTENRFNTVVGRPLLNLSFAVNYALNGTDVRGYHVANVLIHMLAALTLFGVVRRTLELPRIHCFPASRSPILIAFFTALLWAVHPLMTESVTYLCQRMEAMAGLFYLLVFYCVIRGTAMRRAALWYAGAVLSAFLGVATKEIVGTAPVLMLLYDRLFLTGSFKETAHRRWGLYVGLAASWLLLFALVHYNASRDKVAWFGCGITAWEYMRSQPAIILHYLKLTFWPDRLVLDYSWPVARTAREILPGMVIVGSLLAGTLWAICRKPWLGFLGFWFFGILAPTSSFIPIIDLAFEHRMYLPLAAVCVLAAIGTHRIGRQGAWVALGSASILLGARTIIRNHDYRSPLVIWQGAVEQNPKNARAVNAMANALFDRGQYTEAIRYFRSAVALNPDLTVARCNLASALLAIGQTKEAAEQFAETLRRDPLNYFVRVNLGALCVQQKNWAEALAHYEAAASAHPYRAEPHYQIGAIHDARGNMELAIQSYRKAIAIQPDYPEALNDLGIALVQAGQLAEAIECFEKALRLKPDYAKARANLQTARAQRSKQP